MVTNRRILVDNATLSGVERITGTSSTLNLNNIDNDILCFEKLITAILFSDTLIGVDDYKDQYRSSRFKNFSFISFEGSKPAGDVVSFFESLKIDPQMRWDIFTSSEYLTLSLLVNDTKNIRYETAIDSA